MLPKKRTRRASSKYPALDPKLSLKTRYDELDFDYINELPETWTDPVTGKKYNPKQFLNDFANEFIHADFKTNKKRIHKKKRVENKDNKYLRILDKELGNKFKDILLTINNAQISTTSKTKLKTTLNEFKSKLRKEIKECLSFINDIYKKKAEHKNNARNRCILTKAKAQGKSLGIDDLSELLMVSNNLEDEIIDKIDRQNELDFFEKFQDTENGPEDT